MTESNRPNVSYDDEQFIALTLRYLDGFTSPEEQSAIVEQLQSHPARRDQFVMLCRHAGMLHETFRAEAEGNDAFIMIDSELPENTSGRWRAESGEPPIHDSASSIQDSASNPQSPIPNSSHDHSPVSVPSFAPVSGFQGGESHATVGYFSSGWPVAYLVATVVLGVGLLIGAIVHVSTPAQVAVQSPPDTRNKLAPEPKMDFVGRITGMVDCRWVQSPESRVQSPESSSRLSSFVSLGDRFALSSGLMEITYDTGAKVILQGPVTYEVESTAGGFLSVGKLTARVEKRSEIRDRKSEIRNQKSPDLWPLTSDLFAIRTPTAIVTDLGTEFGVEVDQSGATQSHVFRGSVRVQELSADGTVTDASHVLHENQSARVAGDRAAKIVVIENAKRTDFVRDILKPSMKALDLADIVAGGDGCSGLRGRGIDSTDGRPTDTTRKDTNLKDYGPIAGDGKYHRVEMLPLVDGVFIPAGRSGAVQVDSAGHTFAEFGETDGTTGMNIWAGGTVPVPTSSMPSHVSSLLASLPPSQTLAPTRLGGIDYAAPGRGLIFLHANNGITFDLEAIRRVNPDFKLLRFRATAGNVEPVSQTGAAAGYADLWVLVDGQVRFRRRGINGCSGAFPILFSVAENDRFLTLAATDGGNTMAGDWILFGNPVLEMVTSKQKGE
jgi:hypothetical protein